MLHCYGKRNKEWIDFIVRTLNSHQIFIQRIQRDQNLWENIMLPKINPVFVANVKKTLTLVEVHL
jgi:hypothetical protein